MCKRLCHSATGQAGGQEAVHVAVWWCGHPLHPFWSPVSYSCFSPSVFTRFSQPVSLLLMVCLVTGQLTDWQYVKSPLNRSKWCDTHASTQTDVKQFLQFMWLWLKSLCTFFLEQCRWWSGVTSSWRGSVRSCVLWVASSARWWWVHPNVAALIPVLAWCLDLVSANIMWNRRSMFTLSDVVVSSQGSDVEVEVPANLSKYMEAILAFTTHSSQVRLQHFYWRLNFRWTANESVEYESLGCFISCDFVWFLAVFEVVHSGYMGIFVQTWDSVEGSRCRGDGHQIPKSIDDQSSQGEAVAPFTLPCECRNLCESFRCGGGESFAVALMHVQGRIRAAASHCLCDGGLTDPTLIK